MNILTKRFVCGNTLYFLIQAGGARRFDNTERASEIEKAENTDPVGLDLQIVLSL